MNASMYECMSNPIFGLQLVLQALEDSKTYPNCSIQSSHTSECLIIYRSGSYYWFRTETQFSLKKNSSPRRRYIRMLTVHEEIQGITRKSGVGFHRFVRLETPMTPWMQSAKAGDENLFWLTLGKDSACRNWWISCFPSMFVMEVREFPMSNCCAT